MWKKGILVFITALLALQIPVSAKWESPVLKRFQGTAGNEVTVLMYHRLTTKDNEISDFSIKVQDFEDDIKLLKQDGYTFCTATELIELQKGNYRNRKLVAITFDDGYESDYLYALPILTKYNAKATFFVFGDAIGTPGYMTKEQLFTLSQSPNVEIGNHSYKIHNKTIDEVRNLYLSGTNDEWIVNDFMENKKLLESIIHKGVTSLSYPNGFYNHNVNEMLRSRGVKITFSTDPEKDILPLYGKIVGRFNRGLGVDIRDYLNKECK